MQRVDAAEQPLVLIDAVVMRRQPGRDIPLDLLDRVVGMGARQHPEDARHPGEQPPAVLQRRDRVVEGGLGDLPGNALDLRLMVGERALESGRKLRRLDPRERRHAEAAGPVLEEGIGARVERGSGWRFLNVHGHFRVVLGGRSGQAARPHTSLPVRKNWGAAATNPDLIPSFVSWTLPAMNATNVKRRIHWANVSTVVSAAILIGAEVFGAAFAGGWALATLFNLDAIGAQILQGVFILGGIAVMASFIRAAKRVEPFTTAD